MKLNPGLIALSAGAFGIGVTEFAPMGLMPQCFLVAGNASALPVSSRIA